jgi:hypothetical protein
MNYSIILLKKQSMTLEFKCCIMQMLEKDILTEITV